LRRGTFDAVYEAVLALTTLSSLIKPLASVVTGARSDHIGLMALTLEKFAALLCLQYGPAKAGFRLKAVLQASTNFRTGVCSTEL